MTGARPQTPLQGLYNSVPTPNYPTHLNRGYRASASNVSYLNVESNDFASTLGNPIDPSPLSQSLQPHPRIGKFDENFDASQQESPILLGGDISHRFASTASTLNHGAMPSRGGTLKKKGSLRRTGSLKRSGSRRSIHAGSIHGVSIEDSDHISSKENSVFYTPVPTTGTPTEILANRFQGT
jgi:hypothetical protein